MVQRVINLYLDNTDILLKSLAESWESGNLDGIRAASHTLKSSSQQIGAVVLAELCRIVEQDARQQQYDKSADSLAEIQRIAENTRLALKSYLNTLPLSTRLRA